MAASLLLAASMNSGCGGAAIKGVPAGAIVGRPNLYDYSPSVIQSDSTIKVWWCGFAANPNKPSQDSDTIQYSTINSLTGEVSPPQTVMGETPGSWDSAYVCNPQVVGGTFVNPLGDGVTYGYAMYYVATDQESGFGNSIGVAFSKDGLEWKKYPQPVIQMALRTDYGVGQPAPYNSDEKAGIWIFYEDSSAKGGVIHKEATSKDGVHFTTAGTLTTNGLNATDPNASWGDIALDPETGYWYATFNVSLRQPWTTGNSQERGQPGVRLYRIPKDSVLTGQTPWEELHTFDTNATGNESNFIAGFLRDEFGNLDIGPYPTIQMLTSISNPGVAWNATPASLGSSTAPEKWDVGVDSWTPGKSLLPLNRYRNASGHMTTTGFVDPKAGFTLEQTLGYLYEGPQNGANVALYACKDGQTGFFVSRDSQCGSKYIVGLQGYAYAQPQTGVKTASLYQCSDGATQFLSTDAQCEGRGAGQLLGYGLQ